MVVVVLLIAGDQLPVILFVEVVCKAAKLAPEQTGATCVKVGIALGITIISIVAVVAHCPAPGVKV